MLLGRILDGETIVCSRISAYDILRAIGSADIGTQLIGYLLLRLVFAGAHHIDASESQLAQIGDGVGISIRQQLRAILGDGLVRIIGTSERHFDTLCRRAVDQITSAGAHHIVADGTGTIRAYCEHTPRLILRKIVGSNNRQTGITGRNRVMVSGDIIKTGTRHNRRRNQHDQHDSCRTPGNNASRSAIPLNFDIAGGPLPQHDETLHRTACDHAHARQQSHHRE